MARFFTWLFLLVSLGFGSAAAETYRLRYDAAILGVVTIGQATLDVTARDQRYAVRSTLRTSGAARIFDQTDISAVAAGTLAASGPSWARYDLSHAYADKFRRTQMRRSGGEISTDVDPGYGQHMGRPPASASQRSASYDPLTGLFELGRQVGARQACQGDVLIFDGRQHYRLSLAARDGRVSYNGGGFHGQALSCTLRYRPIAGFEMSPQDRDAIPEGELLFALTGQAGFAPFLRLTVPTPVGPARLDLQEYQRL